MVLRLPHCIPLCLLLLGCGQDSNFTKLSDPEPPVQDTSAPPEEPVEAVVIDEPPPECPNAIYAAQLTQVDEDCRIDPPVVRYTPIIEWQMSEWAEVPELYQIQTAPVVGQMTDDNGDGRIDATDTPDIVVVSGYQYPPTTDDAALRMVSGDGTAVHFTRTTWTAGELTLRPIMGGTPALGDVDGDGTPEIVLVVGPSFPGDFVPGSGFSSSYRHSNTVDCYIAIVGNDGELKAVNPEEPIACEGHSPSLADVQADGEIDIIVAAHVFRSSDLARIAIPITDDPRGLGKGHDDTYWNGSITVPVDLEGDGFMEVVTGRQFQEWDGTVRCFTGEYDGWPAVADLDGDGDAEVVISGRNRVLIYDHQCDFVDGWNLDASGRGGPPTIADYDGDGVPEIGFAAADRYTVYETNGTLKWSSPANDNSSNCTGSSVFDFEEDGYAEVVYGDETDLWIISGHNGDFVMRWVGHESWTANEYPTIVDVDGDGEAEIVTVGNHGIAVVAAEEGWAPARQVWNQHAYWITNVNDDLTIPSPTPQNWPEYNSFRSGDLRVNAGQGARLVDAKPFVHDICEIECGEGTVQVALSPNNEGLADAIDGVNLAVYAEQTDGSQVLLEVLTPEDLHRAGYATEGVVLELAMTDLPTGTLILVADDDGTGTGVIEECDETNNELRLEGLCADE